ncbi:MAG: hypothetical protein KH009_02495 [Clostridiales bacterium]|nr:hypothetical protein [Clostridiales bacterium]
MKSIKRRLSLLLICVMLSSLSVPAFATEIQDDTASYDDYFSTVREFEWDEEILEVMPYSINEETPYWLFGNDLFVLEDNSKLVKYDIETGEFQAIYDSNVAIDLIYVSPEIAYFMINSTVYRLYIPTAQLDEVYSSDTLEWFTPHSNVEIIVCETNPAWIEYLTETGDEENLPGISETVDSLYNIAENTKEDYIRYRGEEDFFTPYSSSVDYGDYGPGTYFTKTGKSCSSTKACHTAGVCTYITSTNAYKNLCNCLAYGNGIQCMGYARYVYDQNNGTYDWGTGEVFSYSNSTSAQRTAAAEEMQELVENAAIGSHIRFSDVHSVILIDTTSTGFKVYECNASTKNCEVRSSTYSYSGVVRDYSSIKICE